MVKPAILLIGAGRWGFRHLKVLERLDYEGVCRLVGVVDTDSKTRSFLKENSSANVFSDYSSLDSADAVDIVVPTYEHFGVAKLCLEAGKDIFVEKPLVQNVEEANELDMLRKKTSKIVQVGHIFRYNPATEYLKTLLLKKEIGDVRYIRGHFMAFREPEYDAGILATSAIHFIYVSNYLLGKMPKFVTAKTEQLLGLGLDDFAMLTLDYDSEFSIIETDYFMPEKTRAITIIGTEKIVVADLLNQKIEIHTKKHSKVGKRWEPIDGGVVRPTIEFKEPLESELRHFIKCVSDRLEPSTGISDAIECLNIVQLGYESSQTGKSIPMS